MALDGIPDVKIVSVTPSGHHLVASVECSRARNGLTRSDLATLIDGDARWADACTFTPADSAVGMQLRHIPPR